jgi:hypothetical protein
VSWELQPAIVVSLAEKREREGRGGRHESACMYGNDLLVHFAASRIHAALYWMTATCHSYSQVVEKSKVEKSDVEKSRVEKSEKLRSPTEVQRSAESLEVSYPFPYHPRSLLEYCRFTCSSWPRLCDT